MSERVQKFLARVGVASRRRIEEWIRQGRVTIDNVPAQLGAQVKGTEAISIDGRLIQVSDIQSRRRVLAYYKPVGEVSSRRDPEGRPTIFDRLPVLRSGRWIAIGRLDISTQGLLLLSNDGELANRLMHPSSQVEREYAVRVLGQVTPAMLQCLQEGVLLEDGLARFDEIREAGGEGVNHWYHVILREGRNREVRRLWESQGVAVSRLIRVRYGSVVLRRGLSPGHWDELDEAQMRALLQTAGYPLQDPKPDASKPRSARAVPPKGKSTGRHFSARQATHWLRTREPQKRRIDDAKPVFTASHSSHADHSRPSPTRRPSASTARYRTVNPGRVKSDR
ncbi:MAG: 23S rRNA pseudouridylate synthase B [Candidatus Contendobacter odensis]|uniref:Pseudouridine synthase n=1 Tax=Candidatus Contendibacter odensensis TaxID=1400860 RepID=A0A2G6PES9_9GAMM|nr:MAG: 23S rRNA pseudouridylate synthase B [Candidatus Contendobacter odensis]